MLAQRIFDRLQLDKTLGYALLTRVWQAVSGPLTIALVIAMLNEDQTGIFYGLMNVIAIQTLFELGLLNVLIGHAGHAATAINNAPGSEEQESTNAKARMAELIHASRKWFTAASILFALCSLAIGWFTFSNSDTQTAWMLPLLAIVPAATLTIYFSPSLAILEGSGDRELIYRFGFYTRLTGSFAVWATLYLGFGIWALVVSALVQTCWTAYLPLVHRSGFFQQFKSIDRTATDFTWSKDVVPAQWRAAAVSATHHFATQYFVIILLNFWTTGKAGQLGMTLTVTGAIQMLALAWVQTKFSVISSHHGSGDRETAGTYWRQTAIVSTGLLVVAFTTLIGILLMLPTLQPYVSDWVGKEIDLPSKFITPLQCAILGIGCVANHFVALQGFYVLARKANPLVISSVAGFLIVGIVVWIAGAQYGTDGIVIGFAASVSLVALPLHTIAYMRFRS